MINYDKQKVNSMIKELNNATKGNGNRLNIAAKIADTGLAFAAKIDEAEAQQTRSFAAIYRNLEKGLELAKLELSASRQKYDRMLDTYSKMVSGEITCSEIGGGMCDTMRQCRLIASDIEKREADMMPILQRYIQEYDKAISEITKQVYANIRELKACVEQIHVDRRKYGKYITCICNIESLAGAPKNCGSYEGLEELDNITEEDDQYLKSICDDYKGVEYYRGIVSGWIPEERMHELCASQPFRSGQNIQ